MDANRLWVDSRARVELGVRVEGGALASLGARGATALDVGTGRRGLGARVALTRLGATSVTVLDVHRASMDAARTALADLGDRVVVREGDATALPVGDDSQDLVVSLHTLHHVEDWRTAVRECARLLRPGGQLAYAEMTARFVDLRLLRAVSRHPSDRFSEEQLLRELEAAGFASRPAPLQPGRGALAARRGDPPVTGTLRAAAGPAAPAREVRPPGCPAGDAGQHRPRRGPQGPGLGRPERVARPGRGGRRRAHRSGGPALGDRRGGRAGPRRVGPVVRCAAPRDRTGPVGGPACAPHGPGRLLGPLDAPGVGAFAVAAVSDVVASVVTLPFLAFVLVLGGSRGAVGPAGGLGREQG